MKRPIPAAFTEACRAVERGELALALMHSDALGREHHGSAEHMVMDAFIRRRAERGGDGWLESLVASWESCGWSAQFAFLGGAFVDDAETPTESLMDGAGIALTLWLANTPAILLEGARSQLATPFDTLGRLWVAGQLGAVQRDPALKARAVELRSRVHAELAEANPATFELAALPILDEASQLGRLDTQHIRRLLVALDRDVPRGLAQQLYRQLVDQRQATTASGRHHAWMDAVAILPDASMNVLQLAKRSPHQERELFRLAEQLGSREARSVHALHRIIGLELLRFAASPTEVPVINARLAATRLLLAAQNRFAPYWPIEPLRIEVIDALAHDEVALFSRCLFPA